MFDSVLLRQPNYRTTITLSQWLVKYLRTNVIRYVSETFDSLKARQSVDQISNWCYHVWSYLVSTKWNVCQPLFQETSTCSYSVRSLTTCAPPTANFSPQFVDPLLPSGLLGLMKAMTSMISHRFSMKYDRNSTISVRPLNGTQPYKEGSRPVCITNRWYHFDFLWNMIET